MIFSLKLAGIQKISVVDDETFTPPPEDYNPDDFKITSWYVKASELENTIRVEIREPMASIINQKHTAQLITRTAPDTIELTATVSDFDEIARWVLSCSPHVKVKFPEELRRRVCELAGETLKINRP